ncbi:hypothetical protein [Halalkalibacter oceani]|uniref:hypothetical protein n=1 Tax=Halalkalibacter oceani TaxID=1653776 RepID=UPI00339832C8
MRYSLFVSYVTGEKYGVFSWALANYTGIVQSDQYILRNVSEAESNRACHIGLRRALRQVAKVHPLIQLTVLFDRGTQEAIVLEIVGGDEARFPSLVSAAKRTLSRFNSVDYGLFSDEDDLRPEEAAVIDDAIDLLDELNWWRYFVTLLKDPKKIIH